MHIFDYQSMPEQLLTPEVVRLLTRVHEHRGSQMTLLGQYGNRLIPLRKEAERQSDRASAVEDAAYRACLEEIREHFDTMKPEPSLIRQLYAELFPQSAGGFRKEDAVITELDESGRERERFQPCAPEEIDAAVDALCTSLQMGLAEGRHDPILLTAMFVIDFLSIHPFADGNGKLVWLLQALLLYRAGYYVCAYVSLERLTEQAEDTYQKALQYSSIFWQDSTNSYEPFVCWFLQLLNTAYELFEEQTAYLTAGKTSKGDRIREAVRGWNGPITKRAILERYPDIAVVTVERTLAALVKEGILLKQGGGPATSYRRKEEVS